MRFKQFEGPYRWVFKDPDTDYEYRADSKRDLVRLIVSYRAQNGLDEIEFLGDVIDNYLCGIPENKGKCIPVHKLKRGLMQTLRGGVALLETWLYDKTTTQEVADARADVCVKCPHNTFPEVGAFNHWANQVAEACVGDKRSFHNDQLGVCDICTCPLRAKVFYGGEIELSKEELAQMPGFCWQKKEVEARG